MDPRESLRIRLNTSHEPLLGLECLEFYSYLKYKSKQGCYRCNICMITNLRENQVIPHITCLNHRLAYLKKYHLSLYNKCLENLKLDPKELQIRVVNMSQMVVDSQDQKNIQFTNETLDELIDERKTMNNLSQAENDNWLHKLINHCQNLLNNNTSPVLDINTSQLPTDMTSSSDHGEKFIDHGINDIVKDKFENLDVENHETTNHSFILNDVTNIDVDKTLETLPLLYRIYSNYIHEPLLGLEFMFEHQIYNANEKLKDIFYTCNICYPDRRLYLREYTSKLGIQMAGEEDITRHLLSNNHQRAYLAISDTTLLKRWDKNVKMLCQTPNQLKEANEKLCQDYYSVEGKMGIKIYGMKPERLLQILIQNGGNYEELYGSSSSNGTDSIKPDSPSKTLDKLVYEQQHLIKELLYVLSHGLNHTCISNPQTVSTLRTQLNELLNYITNT